MANIYIADSGSDFPIAVAAIAFALGVVLASLVGLVCVVYWRSRRTLPNKYKPKDEKTRF